jgi:hypothetical protein
MKIAEEQLMAYADGELDGPEREAVERALQDDPALAARAAQMAALRARLQQGLAAELDAPVPERLTALLRRPASVIDLAAARGAPRAAWYASWQAWGGMAASLLLGVLLARSWPGGGEALFEQRAGGVVVARGEVERALSGRLAADAGGPVAVQLSFIDKAGAYCRTFALERSAGLACREGGAWVLQSLAASEAQPAAMRQAASALPAAVLAAVDARIDGSALDAQTERAARDRGWQR